MGTSLSNHTDDTHEAAPTLAAIPPALGTPDAAAMNTGYWSPPTPEACACYGIEPYIATGRDPHHQSWQERFAPCRTRRHRTPAPGLDGRQAQVYAHCAHWHSGHSCYYHVLSERLPGSTLKRRLRI